jgi:hypothetical protein
MFATVEFRKKNELQLLAASNLAQLELNLFAQYRFLDTSHGSLEQSGQTSAVGEVFSDLSPELLVGIEARTPIGNRIGYAAVRHAEMELARSSAICSSWTLRTNWLWPWPNSTERTCWPKR